MTTISSTAIPAIGAPFQGGFYAGQLAINGEIYGLIVSPKEQGEVNESAWGKRGKDIVGAHSYFDGQANTSAMTESGSDLARWIQALDIGGFTDWYLPSRDELEIIYRSFKPTTETNYTYRSGDNPSSLPAGYPYTELLPAQTAAAVFREGGTEALEAAWHWSSTQYSPYVAWGQGFVDGDQNGGRKDDECRARAVRRFKITP